MIYDSTVSSSKKYKQQQFSMKFYYDGRQKDFVTKELEKLK